MTTAKLSVGIDTGPAKTALDALKAELKNVGVPLTVKLDKGSVEKSLSGLKVSIDVANLTSQVRRAVQDGFSGVKLGDYGGAAGIKQLQAEFKKVEQAAKVTSAEVGKALDGAAIASVATSTKKLGEAHKEATTHTKTHAAAMRDAHSAARGLASGFGLIWLTWGNIAPLLAGASLSHGFMQAMKAGSEFAYQLTFVKALGGETAESIAGISRAALELTKTSLYGPVELANGLRILSQAGLSASESMAALPAVTNLATVGEMSMRDAAITLAGVMTAFNLEKSDFTKIGDVFAKAAAISQTSVEQMTQAMKTASVVGEQYGASMGDTATALTLLARLNITGTAAGTSLRNMLKEIYTPIDRTAKVMKQLGLSAQTATGDLKPFPDFIFELRKKLEEFNKAGQVKILQELFGERGAKEAVAMLSQTREEWDKLNKTISDSRGFMKEVAAELEGTVKGSFKQAINTLQASLIEAYESSDGKAGELAGKLKETFGSQDFKDSLTAIVSGVVSLTNALVTMAPALAMVAGGWVALRAALLATSAWSAVSTALAGATLGLQTMGAVASGTATSLTGATGLMAAMRVLPTTLAAAGASLVATTGLLGPLALAIGAAGIAWYLFRDRTVEAMQQSSQAVATGVNSMQSSLARISEQIYNLPAAASRSAIDAKRGELAQLYGEALKAKGELQKAYGFTSDADVKKFVDSSTTDDGYGGTYTRVSKKYEAATTYLKMKADLRQATLDFGKVNQKVEDRAQFEADTVTTALATGSKSFAREENASGRAAREAGKYESERLKNVLKDQTAIERLYDAHYKRLLDVENASAQAGLVTREQAEVRVAEITEEQTKTRITINENFHNVLKDMLKTSGNLSASQREQIEGELERRGLSILQLQEELELKRELAKIASAGYQKRFDQAISKTQVEIGKDAKAYRLSKLGDGLTGAQRSRAAGELLVEDKFAQQLQAANDQLDTAKYGKDQSAIDAAVKRLDDLKAKIAEVKQETGAYFEQVYKDSQTAEYGWNKFWNDYEENATTAAKVVEQSLTSVTKNLEDAFADVFATGTFDSKKMFNAILSDIGRLTAKMAVSDLGHLLFGKGQSSGKTLESVLMGKQGSKDGGSGGIVDEGVSALKRLWSAVTGTSSATEDATTKTIEGVAKTVMKTTTETTATTALTQLSLAAQSAATSLSMIGTAGGGGGGSGLGSILGMFGGGGASSLAGTAATYGTMVGSQQTAMLAAQDMAFAFLAKGGAFTSNGVKAFAKGGAFTNSIVSQPTMFRFADGIGLMGEAGAEAIMPLGRDSQGRLGVRFQGKEAPQQRSEHRSMTNNINVNVNSKNGDPAEIRRSGAAVARQVAGAVASSSRYR